MKFRFSIDRGGTFTDVYAEIPVAPYFAVIKLLSVNPANYDDAPREGIRRIIEKVTGVAIPKNKVPTKDIEWIRMGTTVATNALLERKGVKVVLVTNQGFGDLLQIGNQARPHIFDLQIKKPSLLYEKVIQVDERVMLCPVEDGSERIQGVTGEWIKILKRPDIDKIRRDLQVAYDEGIKSVAVVLMHSYTFHDHEKIIGEIAKQIGFDQVSLSSELMPMVKIVPRGQTSCVDAYLTPLITSYVKDFLRGFDGDVPVSFMMSDGGLCPVDQFRGFRSILSGPAGGVVGYSMTTFNSTARQIIGFDMGGTSTDVSRYAGSFDHVFDTEIAGVIMQAPQLDINTVAAGGGSRLFFRSGLFVVGPESAGAHPGPVCYRKNGYLTITDANLLLGRLLPEYFPKIFGPTEDQPLDQEATKAAFAEMARSVNEFMATQSQAPMTIDDIAYGFVRVADESMCRPIRNITEAKGYDASSHVLACFGGAGGQHACSIARNLGMKKIFVHKFSGILSAYGLGLADTVAEMQEPCAMDYSPDNLPSITARMDSLVEKATSNLRNQGFADDLISVEKYLNLRYSGTDTSIMTPQSEADGQFDGDAGKAFAAQYLREYGFIMQGRSIMVDDVRARAIGRGKPVKALSVPEASGDPKISTYTDAYFHPDGRQKTPVLLLSDLGGGHVIKGPAIIIDQTSTIVVEPDCTARITVPEGNIEITIGTGERKPIGVEVDPILLSVFGHRFMSIAEQMGRTLQRTSISTNIKERLDFSCALFGPDGGLVANAPHLPVHLGSMQEAVKWQINHLGDSWKEGEVLVSNHPAAGGSHLPDITVITPVYHRGKAVFFVASRGHHADIGGATPGSMPPFSHTLEEEGAAIKSFKLVEGGKFQEEGVRQILAKSRNLEDNISDLRAQVAANRKGITLMEDLIDHYGLDVVHAYMHHVQSNAELAVRDMLCEISERHHLKPVDQLHAVDYMDDGTPIDLTLTIDREKKTAIFDFTGTGPEVYGNTNAPVAVTTSAIIYCLRCLVRREIPLNQGCLNPITIIVPDNCILRPHDAAGVVGGNVLTSQRVTDVILAAFRATAASQGCMNNLTFGDDRVGYYETIAGGAGAGPTWDGADSVQVHMTNTRITDAEVLERRYSVLLREFSVRRGSGGRQGLHRGGDGTVREIEFLKDYTVSILSERRAFAPPGLLGGQDALRGMNLLIRTDGRVINLGGKNSVDVHRGDRIRIMTPGGGAFGTSSK